MSNEIILETALRAFISESKSLGCDLDAIFENAKIGLSESKKEYAAPSTVLRHQATTKLRELINEINK